MTDVLQKQISIVQTPPPRGFHLDIQLFNLKYVGKTLNFKNNTL